MSITRGMKSRSPPPKKEASPPPPPPTPPQSHTTSISDTPNNQQPPQISQPDPIPESGLDYEHFREQRIKENRQRLEKLGIVDISLKLKSLAPSKRTPRQQSERKTPLKFTFPTSEPIRRSSRLQNVTPVTYTEQKEDKSKRNQDILVEEGSRPEFYTEEHEKLLGSTEMPWTFFVDGYRADGTRIYDPVTGKTCHQCRQKTLGLRTHCCQCKLVQGQFCGDCLYMRYGEHVLEANQNPEWKCPACRGICNCSLCRHAKGWPATGSLYRKISSLGFKSVAHYLITTKRAPPNLENKCTEIVLSAKRALPFEGMEVPGGEESQITENEAKPTSKSVGRSRKSKREDVGDEEEKANKKIDENVEDAPTSNSGTNARRLRPRTKRAPPNSENNCTEIVLSEKRALPFEGMEVPGGEETQITENEAKPTSKSVGRSRKSTKREDVRDEEEKASKKIDENVEDAPTSNSGTNARRLRPRTKCAPPYSENKCTEIVLSAKRALPFEGMEVPGGEETQITENEAKPTSKSVGRPRKSTKREDVSDEKIDENVEDAPTSNSGTNARRLRPRTKSATPNSENKCTEIVLSAKRALPFEGMEVPGDEETQITENEAKPSSESVGRSRKRTKRKDVSDASTSNSGTNARRLRPRTKA